MKRYEIRPNSNFTSFFGCDGVGKSTITSMISLIERDRMLLVRASNPASWPDVKPEEDFASLEEIIRKMPESPSRLLARYNFTNAVVIANYRMARRLSKNTHVLNDSDVLVKALVWTAINKESLSKRFNEFTRILSENVEGNFPATIVYVHAPGTPEEQSGDIYSRITKRLELSPSDPVTISDIRHRVAANMSVFNFLEENSESYGFAVHGVENPLSSQNRREQLIKQISQQIIGQISNNG